MYRLLPIETTYGVPTAFNCVPIIVVPVVAPKLPVVLGKTLSVDVPEMLFGAPPEAISNAMVQPVGKDGVHFPIVLAAGGMVVLAISTPLVKMGLYTICSCVAGRSKTQPYWVFPETQSVVLIQHTVKVCSARVVAVELVVLIESATNAVRVKVRYGVVVISDNEA